MQIGKKYKYISQDEPEIPYGTVMEVTAMEVREIGTPFVTAVKVGSSDKQEYVIMANELEACE